MSDEIHNPVAIEKRILEVTNRIGASASECNRRYLARQETERAFEQAYAKAYMSHDGPQQEKRYAATLATAAEKEAADVAEAAYRYAAQLARTLESELMAYQSVSRSVGRMYNAAGTGER